MTDVTESNINFLSLKVEYYQIRNECHHLLSNDELTNIIELYRSDDKANIIIAIELMKLKLKDNG